MSTAQEVQLRQAEAERWLEKVTRIVQQEMVDPITLNVFGREVCARRARKLRARGDVVRFKKWTATGKCRYSWAPRWFKLTFDE